MDFARTVGTYRFFGPGPETAPGEAATSRALATSSAIDTATLRTFAAGLDGVCTRNADSRPLGAATVDLQGAVAIVHPGTGPVAIPKEAAAVAIDLRDLPQSAELMPALERAFAPTSIANVALLDESFRKCNGEPDEVFAVLEKTQNVYFCTVNNVAGRSLTATGTADLPLAVLTGPEIAPDAAAFAVALRARRRAWLVGEDIPAGVAEMDWFGIGAAGLGVRTRTLSAAAGKIPDVVSADVRATDPVGEWTARPHSDAPPAISGDAARSEFPVRSLPTALRKATNEPGEGRAALVVAYAAARTFEPYIDELGSPLDTRLGEAMQQLDAEGGGRPAVMRALGRLTESLSDGHVFLLDAADKSRGAAVPISVLPVGTDIVVATSATALVSPGETILAVDGQPVTAALARIEALTSCSPHEKASFAAESLIKPTSVLHVRGMDGTERDVTLAGGAEASASFGMWDRAPGTLGDLGAPDIFYVTLNDGAYAPAKLALSTVDAGLAAARAVVLDMRGYPDPGSWNILSRVIPPSAPGPAMAMLDVAAHAIVSVPLPPQLLSTFVSSGGPSFNGPVILLVGPSTQSQAEHLTSFFRNAKRGMVIGEQTSGANGNITGTQLPGGYAATFTGMHVAHVDGSRFFGIGHIPDVAVAPTALDYHDRRDAVLAKAIQLLAAH